MINAEKIKIVFLGTPEFAVKPLEALIKNGYGIVGVITAPDKPKGRKMVLAPPPIKILAGQRNIPAWQPINLISNLRFPVSKPDLFVVAAYGKILPKEILEIPKFGTLNIHPSLLPRWRGPSPIQSAILAGDEKTGVTIMLVNEKMDEGPILARQELKYSISNIQSLKLQDELSELGAKLLIETLPKWINGEIKPQQQDNSKATYSKIIKKENGLINWNEPAEIIERKIRAFTPWPGAYAFINGKRIVITEAGLNKNNALAIKRVKPEGKKEMSYEDYLRGNPDFPRL